MKENEMEKLITDAYQIVAYHCGLLSHDGMVKLIARIGKAFRDGDLDEALGVVGRGEFVRDSLGLITPSWNKPPREPLATKEPWHRFIALCPKED